MPISWDYGHELVFTMYTELIPALCSTWRSARWWPCANCSIFSPGGSCPAGSGSSILVHQLPDHDVPDGGVHSGSHVRGRQQRLVHHAVYGLHALPPLPQPGGGHGVVPAG